MSESWGALRGVPSKLALAGALTGLIVGSGLLTAPIPALAAEPEPAYVELVKIATPAPPTAIGPGDLVTFTFTINCSSDVAACVDLQVSDTLPEPLVLENVSMSGSDAEGSFVTTENSFVLTFTNDLGAGEQGLPDGVSVEFIATARVPTDASADFDGVTVTNTAYATLAYSASNTSDDADVLLAIPTTLDSGLVKTVTPTVVNANPGNEVEYRLSASNDSNTAVDALVIQDPAVVGISPFGYLEPAELSVDSWPTGADRVQVDWYDGAAWHLGSPVATPVLPTPGGGEAIEGLRFTFSSSTGGTIDRDAVGEILLGTELLPNVDDIATSATVTNTASSWVEFDGSSSTPVTDPASVQIDAVSVSPVASKLFSPNSVVGGETVDVTLRAENGGDYNLASLTVTEPATGQPDLLDQGLQFQSWNAGDVEWPVGATSAQVSYRYDGDADFSAAATVSRPAALPEPTAPDVRAIRVVFLGNMAPGQYAVLPYSALAESVATDVTTTDTISVDAVTTGASPLSASTTASDDLTRRSVRVDAFATKTASPDELYAVAGATSVISIVAGVSAEPTSPTDTGGSTIGATRLVVTDPVGAGSGFWEDFSLGRILSTDVPAGSTLTVEYLDISGAPTWTALGSTTTGPATFSHVLGSTQRDNMGGIRFVYLPSGQPDLPPGFTVGINLRVALRAAGIDVDATVPYVISNVAEATVENVAATPPTVSDDDNADLTLTPVGGSGGSGGLDLLRKDWQDTVIDARSGDTAQATITWGTGGLGFHSVVVADSALDPDDPGFQVQDSVYDAFDLVRIPAISSSEDALLTYDRVTAVELYIPGSGWIPTYTNPCAGTACDGTFPGYTLRASEQENAIGVRLVIEESPTRAARIDADDPYAPPVGSGVAATTPLVRAIDLDFRVRDERRSNGDPVLGSNRGTIYNTSAPGAVSNSARVDGRDGTGAVLHTDEDADSIQLIDRPLNVTANKTWTGGPLGVPDDGTPAELFPQARMTLTATNATVVPVDGLSLTEPGVVGAGTVPDPFDALDLADIVSISVPSGAASTSVVLGPLSSYPDQYTVSEALALTATELAEATSIQVVHAGRIDAGASTVVVIDTRLREYLRSEPATRVGVLNSPVTNTVLAEVSDLGGVWAGAPEDAPEPGDVLTAVDDADAEITVSNPVVGVVATKLITADTASTDSSPAIQYGDSSATAMVRLTGQPTGNVRYTDMILEDTSATFWNAYAFAAFSSHTFANPIDRVQVDALVDVVYGIGAGNSLTVTGGTWVEGEPRTTLVLPDGVIAADVRGLRFTYSRADGSVWERPYNPLQTVLFTVSRRDDLLTGGPVPSTIYVDAPGIAPGETEQATFTDTVEVTVNARESATDPALWSATDSATAQIRYQHLPANVEIRTSPAGNIALGDTIGYEITVDNIGGAGDKTLTGVVVTDLLPVDGLGDSYLVFPSDPDDDHVYDPNVAADAAEIFDFELRNASNVLQPTPTVDVMLDTVETAPGSGVFQPRLTFTVDDDIPLGWVLTISADMEFRPQLEAGTLVETTARVTSDQEFDSCGTHYVNDAATSDVYLETASCFTTTTVTPLPSAPLTVAKGVKGIEAGPLDAAGDPLLDGFGDPYDDLGVVNVSSSSTLDCSVPNTTITVNGGGYYRYPCAPITRPGATEEWAASFTNSGNVSVRQIVAIDLLPRPDDTGVTIPTARGSKWTAKLSTYPVAQGLPTGATLTVYYTDEVGMASARCNGADIQNSMGMTPTSDPPMQSSYQACLTDTGAPDDVPNRVWTVLPNDPGVWATVVALKFVVTMDDSAGLANLLGPGSQVSVTYRTTTALAPEIGEASADRGLDSIAYNSIAAAATGRIYEDTDPLDLAYRLVNEPRKAGVALAVGEIELLKQNTGAAVGYAPSSITATLACTVDVDGTPVPISLLDSSRADRSTLTLTPGTTALVQGIPLYASCAVTEADDYGRTDVTTDPVSSVLVARAAQAMASRTVWDPHPAFGAPERPETELATITNDYQAASLVVSKTVDTSGAVNQSGTPIVYTAPVFSVSCRFDNGVTNPTIFSVTGLTISGGSSVTFPRPATSDPVLPAGSVCTVTETNTRNATTTRYTVTTEAGAGSATTGTAATVTLTPNDAGAATNQVAFTNTYGAGSLTISKQITGLGATEYGTGDFTMSLSCTRTSASPSTVWSGTFTLNAGTPTRRIDNVPAGAICTVTETNAAGATSTTFSPQQSGVPTAGRATVPNGTNTTITVTNVFDLARIAITKDVRTDAVDALNLPVYPTDTYDIDVTCTFQGAAVTADGYSSSPMHLTDVERAETVILTGLPAGASCVVTEVDIPSEVDSTSIVWGTSATSGTVSGASATFVLTRDTSSTTGTNTVTVVNRYFVTALTVAKDVRGGAGDQFGTGPFEIAVECIAPGGVTAYDGTITLPTALGAWQQTIEDLPDHAVCAIEETNAADTGADVTRYVDAGGDPFDGTGIEITTDEPGTVTIENWYLTGAVTVGKTVQGDAGEAYGDGPFEVTLDCTRDVDGTPAAVDGYPQSVYLSDGETTTFTGLPSGADCTLTETDAGGASSSRIVATADPDTALTSDVATGYDFTVTVDAADLTDDQTQPALQVVNSFALAGLVVSKTVQSDAVDESGASIEYGPFPVEVSCTFEGSPVYADGYGPSTPMTHSFADGGPDWQLTGLVSGATCDVTETDRMGSAASRIAMTPSGGSTSTSFASPSSTDLDATIVLARRSGGADENTAAIRNDYESGTIELTKVLDGEGVDWATEPFRIDLVCTLADGPVDSVVWDASYDVSAGGLDIPDLVGVAAGASCTLTETRTGGANSTSVDVDGTVTSGTTASFISPADAVLPVTVTNVFDLAALDVHKERLGDADIVSLYGVGPFEVTAVCTREVNGSTLAFTIPDGATRELTAVGMYSASYEGLPADAECEITETRTGGANSSAVTPGVLTVAAGRTDVTVSNTFTSGSVEVEKVLEGDGTMYATAPFYVTLSCTRDIDGTTVVVDIPPPPSPIDGVSDPAVRELSVANSYRTEFADLPTGADCEIVESGTGGASSSAIDVTDFTIGDAVAQTVVVTNTFELTELTVTNQVIGNAAAPKLADDFVIELECALDVNGAEAEVTIPDGEERDFKHDETVMYEELPVGADCGLTETDDRGANRVMVMQGGREVELFTLSLDAAAMEINVVNVFNRLASTGVVLGWGILFAVIGLTVGMVFVFVDSRRRRRA